MPRTALLSVAFLALLAAFAPTTAAQEQPAEIMPVSQVKAGMKGYGLTTLKDGPPERFDFKVIGVLTGWDPKADLILIHATGPIIDQAGIVAGMSGSPVYIDEKLVGAVAYGWSFTKIPLGGVQPIEQMLKVKEIAGKANPEQSGADARAAGLQRLRRISKQLAELGAKDPFLGERSRALEDTLLAGSAPTTLSGRASNGMGMQPLPVPLSMCGFNASPRVLELLRNRGLVPMQAGTEMQIEGAPDKLVPGGPVAIPLVSGDMDLSASGTVTWVHDDEFLAFGHPMFGMGPADFPIATARAVATVPSMWSSFRLTSTGKTIGSMTHDHASAIRGVVGRSSPTFPLRVGVKGVLPDEFNYTVTGHWDWGPWLSLIATYYTVSRWDFGGGEPVTYHLRSRIRIKDRPEVIEFDTEDTGYSMLQQLFNQFYYPAGTILMNDFQEVQLAGMELDVEVTPGMKAAYIENAKLLTPEVKPGDTVEIEVTLRPWRGKSFRRRVSIEVPDTARPGSPLPVIVCDSRTSLSIDRSMDRGLNAPENMDQLIRALQQQPESNRNIVVRAGVIKQGVRYDGAAMPSLPPSVAGIIRSSHSAPPVLPLSEDVKDSLQTEWIIHGSRTLSVPVIAE